MASLKMVAVIASSNCAFRTGRPVPRMAAPATKSFFIFDRMGLARTSHGSNPAFVARPPAASSLFVGVRRAMLAAHDPETIRTGRD
jgi:hypothetical protein